MPRDTFRVLSKRYWTAVSKLSAEDVLILKTLIDPAQRDEFAVSSPNYTWQNFEAAKFPGHHDKLGFPKVPLGPIGPKTVARLRELVAQSLPGKAALSTPSATSTKSLINSSQSPPGDSLGQILLFALTPDRLDWVSGIYKIKRDRIILNHLPSDFDNRHCLRLYIQSTYYEFVGWFESPNIFLFDPKAYRSQLNGLAAEYKKLKLV